jgi:hypothetical protein
MMKFYVLSLVASALLIASGNASFASKADYCAAYAHDFANGQTQDKALWQHKYEIAMTDCLGESAAAEPVNTTKVKTAVKTKSVEQKVASATSKIVKPLIARAATQTKLQPGSEAWNNYCTNKYASFSAKTGTYTSKTGVIRKCIVFYP